MVIKRYLLGLNRMIFVKTPIFILKIWCYIFNPITKFTTYPRINLSNLILFQAHKTIDFKIRNQGIMFNGIFRVPAIRGSRLFEKEPDTINWIRDYFKKGDIFFDIGANTGVYSLYANSLNRNITSFAFEPEASNFFILNDNIRLNEASKSIKAYSIAISDSSSIGSLLLSDGSPGKSGHSFNDEDQIIKTNEQGVIAFSLDDLIESWGMLVPNHIKIDVDGNEDKIISGMKNTLQNIRLRSLAIELDLSAKEHSSMYDFLKNFGFNPLNDLKYQNQKYMIRNYFFIRS